MVYLNFTIFFDCASFRRCLSLSLYKNTFPTHFMTQALFTIKDHHSFALHHHSKPSCHYTSSPHHSNFSYHHLSERYFYNFSSLSSSPLVVFSTIIIQILVLPFHYTISVHHHPYHNCSSHHHHSIKRFNKLITTILHNNLHSHHHHFNTTSTISPSSLTTINLFLITYKKKQKQTSLLSRKKANQHKTSTHSSPSKSLPHSGCSRRPFPHNTRGGGGFGRRQYERSRA